MGPHKHNTQHDCDKDNQHSLRQQTCSWPKIAPTLPAPTRTHVIHVEIVSQTLVHLELFQLYNLLLLKNYGVV